MDCPRCRMMNPPDSVLCDCGTRLDVVGYLPGESRPTLSALWHTLRNLKRLREARLDKFSRVQVIERTFQHLAQLSDKEVASSTDLPVDGSEAARDCIEVNEKVLSYRSWIRWETQRESVLKGGQPSLQAGIT